MKYTPLFFLWLFDKVIFDSAGHTNAFNHLTPVTVENSNVSIVDATQNAESGRFHKRHSIEYLERMALVMLIKEKTSLLMTSLNEEVTLLAVLVLSFFQTRYACVSYFGFSHFIHLLP